MRFNFSYCLLSVSGLAMSSLAALASEQSAIAQGGYQLQVQSCQRSPKITREILCRIQITNQKPSPGNPVIFLRKGYTRAVATNSQSFGADYIAIAHQKAHTNLIPHLNPGATTTVTLSFSKVPTTITQFSSLTVHYREDDGGSPYVGDYFAAVFQTVQILPPTSPLNR